MVSANKVGEPSGVVSPIDDAFLLALLPSSIARTFIHTRIRTNLSNVCAAEGCIGENILCCTKMNECSYTVQSLNFNECSKCCCLCALNDADTSGRTKHAAHRIHYSLDVRNFCWS